MNTTTTPSPESINIRVFGDDLGEVTEADRDLYISLLSSRLQACFPSTEINVEDCPNLGGYNGGPKIYMADAMDMEGEEAARDEVNRIVEQLFNSPDWVATK